MIFEIRVSFQFFRIFSNFHFNSPFNLSLITFDDDYERKREGLHEFTWTCLEIRTKKILRLFLIVLVSSTKRLKINQFLLLSLSLIQNKLRLSLLLFFKLLPVIAFLRSNCRKRISGSMMKITRVISENLIEFEHFC
jgi:hypothetical protein